MNIIILGAPASGKGTQAELLAKKFNLYHLQSGDIARELAKKDERLNKIINGGKLIPEEEMTMYVLDFLHQNRPKFRNILFEGYPRFITQYNALEKFLQYKGDDIDLVISLEVSKKTSVDRISSRRICTNCHEIFNLLTNPPKMEGKCDKCNGKLIQREDDNPKSVAVRFEYYLENTKELINHLKNKGKLAKVDGDRPIDVISKDLLRLVAKAKKTDNNK